jgi:sensor histidine kinase YesM
MLPKKRKGWISSLVWPLVWANSAVAVVVVILVMGERITGLRQVLHLLAYALVYANLVSLIAVMLIGVLSRVSAPRKLSLTTVMVFCFVVVIPLGCLTVQVLLMALRIAVPRDFWHEYLSTLRICMPLAAVFGLGAFAHASLRDRLEATEERLQEKELAEERARKLAAEARLRSLEARVRPHFLFNTLNSISSLIASDPARAEQIVGRLATLLRTSLDTNDRPLILVREELAIVRSYIDIERARFGDKLRASFDVPTDLQEAKVPPMSVQCLVENAVKHGITPQRSGGDIRVAAQTENGNLQIEISDSGPGFDLSAVSPGHGLENLVGRLNALFGDKARLNASRRDSRCVVEMILPWL